MKDCLHGSHNPPCVHFIAITLNNAQLKYKWTQIYSYYYDTDLLSPYGKKSTTTTTL